MSFIEQHPNYNFYTHDSYRLKDLPIFFKRDFSNLIHALLTHHSENEELLFTAWSLQNHLAALATDSPSERGPYDYQMDEIRRVTRKIFEKGFPYVMDAIGLLLSFFDNEKEINNFLIDNDFGYSCTIFSQEIIWECRDGVVDTSAIPPSILDSLVNRGRSRAGFFATVTQYEDSKTGEKYALKRLKSEFNDNDIYKKRFKREITILNRMKGNQSNIIPIIESRFDENSQDYWYLMPYVPTNLYDFVKQYNNNLELSERLSLFSQILDAIEYAHSQGILHRDLSAHNVLLDKDRKVLVSDFGLGKDFTNLTKHGYSSVSGYGSMLYVAPEQQENLKNATEKSDVYSLGKLLYFILTGRDPRTTRDIDKFSSLINNSTLDNSDGRYEDATHFKREFLKYKSFYEQVSSTPTRTVADLVSKNQDFDWMDFHEIVLKAESYQHIYYDFLEPVLTALSDKKTIEEYLLMINTDIQKVVELYVEKLHECYSTVGWPFNALNSFGYFLSRLYESTADYPSTRLILLKELWSIATEQDQWAVQDIVISLIRHNKISEAIELDFAMYILESGAYFGKLDQIDLTRTSDMLKNAITQLRMQHN